jgi:hypothetical protein
MSVMIEMFCCLSEILKVLHVKTDKFIVLKYAHNIQKASSSRLSQMSLNI